MKSTYQNIDIVFDECKFNREFYADTIINLIVERDSMQRETNSLVLALDSSWGTGKTTFVKMLNNKIEKENSDISVVMYDAWSNDYLDNGMNPLMYDILRNDLFSKYRGTKNFIKLSKSAMKLGMITKYTMLPKGARERMEVIAVPAKETLNAGKALIESGVVGFEDIEEIRISISTFKEALTDYIKKSDKELLIIVDELDRCNPFFAIKTLETIKHLFDIEKVTFLLVVDFEQLKHSISTVYGQNMDGEAYLRKFINYKIKLPEPSKRQYISHLLSVKPLPIENDPEIANSVIKTFNFFDLSIRDINTIYENFYFIFISRFKNKENNFLAINYLILLIVKYKKPDLYSGLVKSKKEDAPSGGFFRAHEIKLNELYATFVPQNHKDLQRVLSVLLENFLVILDGGHMMRHFSDRKCKYDLLEIGGDNGKPFRKILFRNIDVLEFNSLNREDMTLMQFFAHQLEMFDFSVD